MLEHTCRTDFGATVNSETTKSEFVTRSFKAPRKLAVGKLVGSKRHIHNWLSSYTQEEFKLGLETRVHQPVNALNGIILRGIPVPGIAVSWELVINDARR